ncbi:MAG: hypothetical protein GEV09_02585 [Pseudonocardiaceae bacterium]|nr:hypothetical protein [Pseudonocardiaceae bacterium]
MSSVQVVDPSGSEPPSAHVATAARPSVLAGAHIGALDNGKPNADHVVGRLARYLRRRFDTQEPMAAGKAVASQPCPDEVLVGFRGFDAAIVGVGD